MFLKNKKIIFLISALLMLNLIFLFDIFFIKGVDAEESYCYSKNQIFYYPESLVISENRTCDIDCNPENNGRLLFKYYGEDSNCFSDDKKNIYVKQKCLEKYPFGGPGTLETGGNLVVNNVSGFYINGRDNGGFHWILSGANQEFQGRAMGFKLGLEDVYFGRSVVVGGNLDLKGKIDLIDNNFIARSMESWSSMPGLSCTAVGPTSYPFNEINFNDNIHILEGNDLDNNGDDVGVCSDNYCDDNNVKQCLLSSGGTYRTILDEATVIKGNLKVEDDMIVFLGGSVPTEPVRYKKQIVRDYYRQIEERQEEFTANTACCVSFLTKRDCYGIYYPNVFAVKRCWPQPLNHYKIINYRYDSLLKSAVGDIVLCPSMANNTTGVPNDVSCQSCESSDLITYPVAKTYGCPE